MITSGLRALMLKWLDSDVEMRTVRLIFREPRSETPRSNTQALPRMHWAGESQHSVSTARDIFANRFMDRVYCMGPCLCKPGRRGTRPNWLPRV